MSIKNSQFLYEFKKNINPLPLTTLDRKSITNVVYYSRASWKYYWLTGEGGCFLSCDTNCWPSYNSSDLVVIGCCFKRLSVAKWNSDTLVNSVATLGWWAACGARAFRRNDSFFFKFFLVSSCSCLILSISITSLVLFLESILPLSRLEYIRDNRVNKIRTAG